MTHVEMEVQKVLMNPEFEGYKLSLDNVPCFMTEISESMRPQSLADDQVMCRRCIFLR